MKRIFGFLAMLALARVRPVAPIVIAATAQALVNRVRRLSRVAFIFDIRHYVVRARRQPIARVQLTNDRKKYGEMSPPYFSVI